MPDSGVTTSAISAPVDERRLDLAYRAAAGLVGVAGVDSIFLGGSLLDGLGTAASDVDVYLVGDALAEGRRQLGVGRVRVDVQHIPAHRLASAVAGVAAATTADATAPTIPASDLDLVVRFRTGRIVSDDGRLAELRSSLDEHRNDLRRQLLRHWLTVAHLWWEDQAGFLQTKDDDAALAAGRHALVAAGKAVAAASSDYYSGPKWVWRQLARSAPDTMPLERFRRLLRADLLGDDGPGLVELARLAQTLSLAAATIGWHQGTLHDWPAWEAGPGELTRVDGWFPRSADGCVIASLAGRRRIRMRHDTALVWALCHGVDADELIEQVQRVRGGVAAYAGLTPDRCRDVIGGLTRAGLATGREIRP